MNRRKPSRWTLPGIWEVASPRSYTGAVAETDPQKIDHGMLRTAERNGLRARGSMSFSLSRPGTSRPHPWGTHEH